MYRSLKINPNQSISEKINLISASFLGKPYELNALGEGEHGRYDQFPLVRNDAFDCETYVDTVLALALADNDPSFMYHLRHIRYKNGHVSFIDRNHFACLDWNKNNQKQGFLQDITTRIRTADDRPVAMMAEALIDKPNWYQHLSIERIRLKNASAKKKIDRLDALKKAGSKLNRAESKIPYLPLSALFNEKKQANMHLFRQIPNGSIIEIVRPNWNLHDKIGTNLNVSHLGFAVWKNNVLMFRNASSTQQKVVDIPLIHYLRDALTSPTIQGINVQIPVEKQAAHHDQAI